MPADAARHRGGSPPEVLAEREPIRGSAAQPVEQGGFGLGANVTSIVFLVAILGIVVFLWVSRDDVITDDDSVRTGLIASGPRHGFLRAREEAAWTRVDGRIDTMPAGFRAGSPDPAAEKASLQALLIGLR